MEYVEKKKHFLLIGAGLPRNGTMSTKVALEMILPGKCYHMADAMRSQQEWIKILDGKMTDDEFKDFFLSNGYVAAVNAPFILFYERAMAIFPNAKVLLNYRDPESWVRSMKLTVASPANTSFQFPRDVFSLLGIFTTYLNAKGGLATAFRRNGRIGEWIKCLKENRGVEYYNDYVEEVKRNVPKEKLLIFSVKEGWKPLCDFLNVPIPNEPFPYVNETKAFQERMALHNRRAWLVLYECLSVPILSYIFFKHAL